jgi:hypothetical protein
MNKLSALLMVLTALAPLTWAFDAYCNCSLEESSCCSIKTESIEQHCGCEESCDHKLAQEPAAATVIAGNNEILRSSCTQHTSIVDHSVFTTLPNKLLHASFKQTFHSKQIDLLKTVFLLI